jgi:xylulose-5-phosphate/fructose-6-phosphate phosphoketolase
MATRTIEPPVRKGKEQQSLSAYGTARSTVEGKPINAEAAYKINAYWRACNYLSLYAPSAENDEVSAQPRTPMGDIRRT